MPLSPRNLIVACSLACICSLLATPVCGQSNYGQQLQSNNPLGVSIYQSNQIIDHSSMSPDSWSAPPTTNAIPFSTLNTTSLHSPLIAQPATTSVHPNNATTLQGSSSPSEQATAGSFSRQSDTQTNGVASTKPASPSIPDLEATTTKQSQQQLNSLIRQPPTSSVNSAAQSPFKSAKYNHGGQTGLPLIAPNQTAPVSPFRATAGQLPTSPQTPNTATGEFNFGSAINNLPAANPTQQLAIPPAVVKGVPTPTTAGRYPLGINGGLRTVLQMAQPITRPPLPSTYDTLVNQPLTTQPRVTNYLTTGPANPLFSQPNPVAQQPALTPQTIGSLPVYRPDLGHRSPTPTFRGRDHDSGLKMDFEDKKKEYPGLGEILATGRYFGSVSGLFLQPAFLQNSAITQLNSSAAAATFASSEAFDFDYETAPRFRFGFESEFGPGVELDYWQFDQGSNISAFTSNGLNSGQLSSGLFGPSSLTTLEAVNAGDTLSAIHSIDIETFSVMFFKEIKFPISRLNGMFGFQYASVFQVLDAQLTNAGGNLIGAIRSTSDLRAYGPKFKFEYYRPIGHTNLEFVTAFGGSVLFGERDQIVTNMQTPAINQFGADEYVLTSDFYGGVQWKKMTAENRAFYVRLGVTHQSWIGGGSAVSAQDNFGLRGFAFEAGVNR